MWYSHRLECHCRSVDFDSTRRRNKFHSLIHHLEDFPACFCSSIDFHLLWVSEWNRLLLSPSAHTCSRQSSPWLRIRSKTTYTIARYDNVTSLFSLVYIVGLVWHSKRNQYMISSESVISATWRDEGQLCSLDSCWFQLPPVLSVLDLGKWW